MSHLEIATTEIVDMMGAEWAGGSSDELTAMLDPTAAGKALDDLSPEDWCAFGEA